MRKKSFRVLALALLIVGILCLASAFGLTVWKTFAGNDASTGIIGGADAPTFWFVFFHGLGGVPPSCAYVPSCPFPPCLLCG